MKKITLFLLTAAFVLLSTHFSYGQPWVEKSKIVASDRGAGDMFGGENSVDISGDYAVVGSERDQGGAGSAYIYKRDPLTCDWVEIQKLTGLAQGGAPVTNFGYSVAIHNDFIVIGAIEDRYDATGANPLFQAGAVYIYKKNASGPWVFTQRIVCADREIGSRFGSDVDIDGSRIIVGASFEDGDNILPFLPNSGAAYIFEYNGQNWNQTDKIVPFDRGAQDWFGISVAISGDYAIVGAFNEDEDGIGQNTVLNSGSAYVFERNTNTTWTQVDKLVSSDRGTNEFFGISVAIDGDLIIVGATNDFQDENAQASLPKAGSAFIFKRNNQTINNWPLLKKIDASDREQFDQFGYSVSISNGIAIVGAYVEDDGILGNSIEPYAGAVYEFHENGGAWNETQKIVASDRISNDRFGSSVSISDGKLIVGASYEDHDENGTTFLSNSGSAYIFEQNWILPPSQPTIAYNSSSSGLCPATISLYINSGNLNGSTTWQWYAGSCNGTPIGTGNTITVAPSSNTTYYANAVGGCPGTPGPCGSITITPPTSWHQTTKNPAASNANDVTNDVITDQNGDVYVTGSFIGNTTLDGGNNPDEFLFTNSGGMGSYVAKYGECGDLLWSAFATDIAENEGRSIVLDENNGTVYVAGNFIFDLEFFSSQLCGSGSLILNSHRYKGYVAGFDMSSGCIISLDIVINNAFTNCEAITINENSGDLFVGGHSAPNFVGTPSDSYVYKYTPPGGGTIGGPVNNIQAGSPGGNNKVNDMDFDENQDLLWIIGDFEDQVQFSPGGSLNVGLPSVSQDAYLLCYEDAGGFNPVMIARGNTIAWMSGEGIAVDENNSDIYFTGTYRDGVADPFQTGNIPSLPVNAGGFNAYMIGFELNTYQGWSRNAYVNGSHAYGKSVAFGNNKAYFTGNFIDDDINIQALGTFPYTISGPSTSSPHVFVAAYDQGAVGQFGNVTTDPLSNGSFHDAMSITADDNGHAYVVGEYSGTMDYLHTNSGTVPLVSSGAGTNGFTLRAQTQTGSLHRLIAKKDQNLDFESNSAVVIAPNPTNGKGKITIQDYDSESRYSIKIIDLLGQVVLESKLTSSEFYFDLSLKKNGIYIIQLMNGSTRVTGKIVKTD